MKARAILDQLRDDVADPSDERDADIERKRVQRSKAAEVAIGEIENPERRELCLADPKRFLKEYGWCTKYNRPLFYNDWASHHLAMIDAIKERAFNGGDKAVAAPRGDGKSSVTALMAIWVVLAGLRRSIILLGSTGERAKDLFDLIKWHFMRMPKLMGDFPEICDCVRALDGAPSRANKQHVRGVPTDIKWTQDEIIFPKVYGSPYGGVHMKYKGLDSAIRGGRFEFALIDDPETDEVARGEQHWKIERIIDREVAGLAPPDKRISRVVITTIQNPYCYSSRVTNRELKPTFAGDRYGILAEWPERRDLWDEYVAIRQKAQKTITKEYPDGDKDGITALRFYEANRADMDLGAVVTNPARYSSEPNEDGVVVEISALQAFWNRVSDWGMDAVMSELQNDPEDHNKVDDERLSSGVVMNRVNGLERNELPSTPSRITVGLDLGDKYCYWVKVAWFGNGSGAVLDYGVLEVSGMVGRNSRKVSPKVIEVALYDALMEFHSQMEGGENPPEFCLIDSGSGLHTPAVYSFVHDTPGRTYQASKGPSNKFIMPTKVSGERHPFHECYAAWQESHGLWLYHVNTDYWQEWVQGRFRTDTFNQELMEDGKMYFEDGSLSLFQPVQSRDHLSFSHHMTSHERQTRFVDNKGIVSKWVQVNKNNHWLDAIAYAAAAAGCLDIKIEPKASAIPVEVREDPKPETVAVPKPKQEDKPKSTTNRFKRRQGGWIPRRRNR